MNVLEMSSLYKKNADIILQSTNLVKTLESIGKVTFEGSYDYDLMYGGDIDIHVRVDNLSREVVKKLVERLINDDKFSMYQFTNFRDNGKFNNEKRLKNGYPLGYYVGLGYWLDNEKWKIDIWFTDSKNENSIKYADLIKEKCSLEKKKIILEIKKYIKESRIKLPSNKIYDAVLDNGVESIDEFKDKYEI